VEEDVSWRFENASLKETNYITHGYHRYPAKFIPQLAKRLILNYSKLEDLVCDPFMGCGTTIVEALVNKRRAIGIDINPVAVLISKAKSFPLDPKELEILSDQFLQSASFSIDYYKKSNTSKNTEVIDPLVPNNDRIRYWFPPEVIRRNLGIIFQRCLKIDDENIRNFFLCAFSHILKNCSIWLMKSVKPTRDPKKKMPDPYKTFKRHLKKMIKGNQAFFEIIPVKVRENIERYRKLKEGSATKLTIEDNKVNLIITSPPYVTSYEYADLHQLSALWFGWAENIQQFIQQFRTGFIGSIYQQSKKDNSISSELAIETIEKLSKISYRLSIAVQKYFGDMQKCFDEMYRVLKDGGNVCIVIGNTELKKVKILNAEILVEIMTNLGFKLNKIVKRRIPSKILPSTRDSKTGKFISRQNADRIAYPHEYILIMTK